MLQSTPDCMTISVSFSDANGIVCKFLDFLSTSLGVIDYNEQDVSDQELINDSISLHKQFIGSVQGEKLMINFYLITQVPVNSQILNDIVVILSSFYIDKNTEYDKEFQSHLKQIQIEQDKLGFQFINRNIVPQVIDDDQPYQAVYFKLRSHLSQATKNVLLQKSLEYCNSSNSFLFQWFEETLITKIQEDYKLTLMQHLKHQNMIPIVILPQQILLDVSQFILREVIMSNEQVAEIQLKVKEGLQEELKFMETLIEDINTESCMVLGKICDLIITLMKNNQQTEKSFIKDIINVQLNQDLLETTLPDCFQDRQSEYQKAILTFSFIIIDQIYQQIHETLNSIIYEDFVSTEFHTIMADFVEAFMCRITVELKEFALIHSSSTYQFYIKLKETISSILEDIELFLFKTSCIANNQMISLNEILTVYHSLANVRTYQVLQGELSLLIIKELQETLNRDFFFFRPEFRILEDELIKQAVRKFYTYSIEKQDMYKLSTRTKNFGHAITLLGMNLPKQALTLLEKENNNLWFQTVNIVCKPEDTLLDSNNICKTLQNSSNYLVDPILDNKKQYMVIGSQDVYNKITGRVAIILILEDVNGSSLLPSLIIRIDYEKLNLVLHASRMLSGEWESQSLIIKENTQLDQYIENQKSEFGRYNSEFGQSKGDFNSHRNSNQLSRISQDRSYLGDDELLKYKDYLYKKRVLRPSGSLTTSVTSGSIGAGIGCLIIDCLDSNIAWDLKIKRAGFTTLSTSMMGAAMKIPVVGVLISPVLIAYAVTKLVGNKVLSKTEKAKNVGHLGVQSGVGIGLVVASQILIPIPVLGSIVGAAIGGVAAGIYQKILIPKAKASLMIMIKALENRIMYDGLIIYDDKAVKLMKINIVHFKSTKPNGLKFTIFLDINDSEWLTIVTVYLVNEIYYLFNQQYDEQMIKVNQQLQLKPNDKGLNKEFNALVVQFENIEQMNVSWERSRYFITKKQINTLQISTQIGTFVNGMMSNFKL